MSDRMTPLSFEQLMNWMSNEYDNSNSIFGQRDFYKADKNHVLEIFGEKLETPFGPAAGPHTQLAQNIVAAYLCGSRFFELKTVQTLDGEDLPVSKPCILAEDEGYNVEWSTELYVPQAFEEYVKAWFALHVLAVELDLGSPDGFVFNMSVGYDLKGIQSEKIDNFIEGLKDASNTKIFKDCKEYLLKHINVFNRLSAEDVEAVSPHICTSITLSTLHGCPAGEIERIASYLIEEKKLNTFIKCNPTLLGYDFARNTLNEMGYDYVSFTDFHFNDDLQYSDAVPMIKRLQKLASDNQLSFGVKITNTFPVEIRAGELPGEEMYMSGRSLYPLSISLADKLTKDFGGGLRISYSGGADVHNIEAIAQSGIWPVTIATTALKPGGYARMKQIAYVFSGMNYRPYQGVNPDLTDKLASDAKQSPYHLKALKPRPNRKNNKNIPLTNCFIAPCQDGCPIHQDISAYMQLVDQGRMEEALDLIMSKNPLPFITGTICAHRCMSKCTRNFYENSIQIRQSKLIAAKSGYDAVYGKLSSCVNDSDSSSVSVVGGGPAGMAAAYFLARAGKKVTLYSANDALGGTVRYVIPEFRIPQSDVEKDASFLNKLGVNVVRTKRIHSITELPEENPIILAMGAPKSGEMKLSGKEACIDAITFLKDYKSQGGKLDIGREVVVIGGGNTAMDTARAAIRTDGVKKVSLVYRRTRRYMPADEEELKLAMKDGVVFQELLAPASYENSELKCEVMELGEPDASGRRSPVATGKFETIHADTVIAAVGEKVDTAFYKENGLAVNEKGLPIVNEDTMESSLPNVYVIGDGRRGPATVVEAIADARAAADAILVKESPDCDFAGLKIVQPQIEAKDLYVKKGYLCEQYKENDYNRCLNCSVLCENCVDVCPNRANVEICVPDVVMPQIIHVDKLCNECGNCKSFCPYKGAPYQDKLTLFDCYGDFTNSSNDGFFYEEKGKEKVRLRLGDTVFSANTASALLEQGVDVTIVKIIETIFKNYQHLFD